MWLRVCRKKTKTTAKKENKQTKKKERKKETKINYKNAQQKLAKALYIWICANLTTGQEWNDRKVNTE